MAAGLQTLWIFLYVVVFVQYDYSYTDGVQVSIQECFLEELDSRDWVSCWDSSAAAGCAQVLVLLFDMQTDCLLPGVENSGEIPSPAECSQSRQQEISSRRISPRPDQTCQIRSSFHALIDSSQRPDRTAIPGWVSARTIPRSYLCLQSSCYHHSRLV